MENFLDFEQPIVNLEKKLQDLRELARQENVDFSGEISILERKVNSMIDEIYSTLTPWQRVQLSRHPSRPYTADYIDLLFPSFMELHGDRLFADDQAIIAGTAIWPPKDPLSTDIVTLPRREQAVVLIGHQKGRTSKQKIDRNFGMARPEGYRKAMRLMTLAERHGLPVITFIDTPGAYPGADAEERGQAQAIAESIQMMAGLRVPTIAVIIGEGGSGGALAIGIGNKVLMQEYSIYSVISPESCASILWSDASLAERASEKLKMYPPDLLRFQVIDEIVPEPKGGAHRDPVHAATFLRTSLIKNFEPLLQTESKELVRLRRDKFRRMGNFALTSTTSETEN